MASIAAVCVSAGAPGAAGGSGVARRVRPRGRVRVVTLASARDAPIGVDGLKALLESASATLGMCRFVVSNGEAGGILECVHDFGCSEVRYSNPGGRASYATVGIKTFECHVNLDKIHKVVFAESRRKRSDWTGDAEDDGAFYSLYVMRFLDAADRSALAVILHNDNFESEDYNVDDAASGNLEAYKALRAQWGETCLVR